MPDYARHLSLRLHGRTLPWTTPESVPTDGGISLDPTTTFADGSADQDVLSVPGGFGTKAAMQLCLEYDPKPPFDPGTPDAVDPELTAIALASSGTMTPDSVEIARTRRRAPMVA